jgi:transposase
METYIGLDVHAASCTAAVIDGRGKKHGSHVIATNGQALVSFLAAQPGKLHLCMEEGTQSGWLYEILSPRVIELVVVGLRESRGPKNDALDAFVLADKLRTNALPRSVFKGIGPFGTLRQLVKVHASIVQDTVRVQNRLKALFRSRGVATASCNIYSDKDRDAQLSHLPAATQAAAVHLYAQYDALCPVREKARKELVAESHRHAISRILETCPGLGEIRVAQLMAVAVTPDRFRTRRQFWSYCGLGIVMRSSSDWVQAGNGSWTRATVQQTRGLNWNHNAMLKSVFKGAATTVIQQHRGDPMRAHYERLLEGGTKPNLAKVTIARQLAGIVLAMWKTKEAYDPKKLPNPSVT